jgi:glycosyltransferase involved in cell wall biosynthesis
MRIAFYAPLKPPDHPVPSGDRLMARQLISALRAAGHEVAVASSLRAYVGQPDDAAGLEAVEHAAAAERVRLAEEWAAGRPDLWFCYHNYYKSPDLIGPALCARFGVPYVTVEASYSARRNVGVWAKMQDQSLRGAQAAAVNLCLTERDEKGLRAVDASLRLARLAPFIEPISADPRPEAMHLVTVAMMRPGDKVDSYRALAAALAQVDLPWRLTVAGDGPAANEVRSLFAGMPGRVSWLGRLEPAEVQTLLARGAVHVWPGCGEAYGLAYLEAQAAGLPVVAFATAGVPEVVEDGVTGLLVPDGDVAALAVAIRRLLADEALRARMGAAARERVWRRHSLAAASARLDQVLRGVVGG